MKSNDPSHELFPLTETQSWQVQYRPHIPFQLVTTHKAQTIFDMTTQFSDLGPIDSTLETFKDVFATSSVFFITLGLLIVFTRLCVRLATANYWGTLTSDQSFVVGLSSFVLACAHLSLSLAYTSKDIKEFATAPSFYLAVCWSTATLSGVCGGLGVGLLVLVGMTRAI